MKALIEVQHKDAWGNSVARNSSEAHISPEDFNFERIFGSGR